jgi:hypothetical protein
LLDGHTSHVDEFIPEICKVLLIDAESPLQGSVRDTVVLPEPIDDLSHDFSEARGHHLELAVPRRLTETLARSYASHSSIPTGPGTRLIATPSVAYARSLGTSR